jgi:hypothetical protein
VGKSPTRPCGGTIDHPKIFREISDQKASTPGTIILIGLPTPAKPTKDLACNRFMGASRARQLLAVVEMVSASNGANLAVIWDEIRASWGTNWCADSDFGEACRMEVFMRLHHEFCGGLKLIDYVG